MKAKDTLLFNKTTTQNPILARRAWFWHVASHIWLMELASISEATCTSETNSSIVTANKAYRPNAHLLFIVMHYNNGNII